jgi:hypothetical protein
VVEGGRGEAARSLLKNRDCSLAVHVSMVLSCDAAGGRSAPPSGVGTLARDILYLAATGLPKKKGAVACDTKRFYGP